MARWPVLTGLLLGACMHWLPLVPFDGEDQMRLVEGQNSSEPALLLSYCQAADAGLCLKPAGAVDIFPTVPGRPRDEGLHLLLPDRQPWQLVRSTTGALYRRVLPGPLVVQGWLPDCRAAAQQATGLCTAHLIRSHGALDGGPPPRH